MRVMYLVYIVWLAVCISGCGHEPEPVAEAGLKSGDTELTADSSGIVVRKNGKPVIKLKALAFNYKTVRSWEVTRPGDNEIVMRATLPAAVDYYRSTDDTAARKVEVMIRPGPGGFRVYSSNAWGRQVTLQFEYLGDHFFGLLEPLKPDNKRSPDLTGDVIDVDVVGEASNHQENYASAYSTFYMSSYGYGSFFDTFARSRFEFAINGVNRIHLNTGTLDWYIFSGDNGVDIHRNYYKVIGSPKRVPVWGLGPIGWRDQNNGGAAEILQDIDQLSLLKIPFTAWFVDRPYSDGANEWSEMNFNKNFADPKKWIATIRNGYGMEFMTWAATATFGDLRFPKQLAGKFSYIDLSDPASLRDYQAVLQEKQYRYGVKGHKIDRGDEAFPVDEEWADGTPEAERRNKYVYLMIKAHDDVLRKAWGDDEMNFARAASNRSQPYLSALWGGDPRSTWEGMQSNFANAMRTAFQGFPVWGSDVGGYLGEGHIPEDLYTRWLQAGSMSGMFEIKFDGAGGRGRDRVPWRYREEFQDRFRRICAERMRFLPYLYSLAFTSADTGTLMQPMAYRHLDDPETYDIWDQFYLGNAILVAPVFSAEYRRDVYLPEGTWMDLDNPAVRYIGGRSITVKADMEKLPRFVRENSIYVTGNIYQGNSRLWNTDDNTLVIHAFPAGAAGDNQFRYIDLKDNNKLKTIKLSRKENEITLTSDPIATDAQVEVVLDNPPGTVMLNGEKINAGYNELTMLLSIRVSAREKIDLSILL